MVLAATNQIFSLLDPVIESLKILANHFRRHRDVRVAWVTPHGFTQTRSRSPSDPGRLGVLSRGVT